MLPFACLSNGINSSSSGNHMALDVIKTTVSHDHCIGCGMCDAVCPYDAIDMIYNKVKEVEPHIDYDLCADKCSACVNFCPFTEDKIHKEQSKVNELANPNSHGVDGGQYYLAWDKDTGKRLLSASGGAVSAIASSMLENKQVDVVIHAKMLLNAIGKEHYQASLSHSAGEIEDKRSSYYAPISFGDAIKTLKNSDTRALIIGVPCVIRAATELLRKNKQFRNVQLHTIALACSHVTNGQFIDALADSEGLTYTPFLVNLRDKTNAVDASKFNNKFFTKDRTLLIKNRFETLFTTLWRNYFFSKNICFSCSDFWGYTADVSVKDAWGKWADDPLGKSIVITRSEALDKIMKESPSLHVEGLDYSEVIDCQPETTRFKHVDVIDRANKALISKENISNGYLKKYLYSKLSKRLYGAFGIKGLYALLYLASIKTKARKMKKIIIR
jgi:coenzyme F420 hydrogenase subunit beta